MSLAIRRFKVYLRVAVVAVVLLSVGWVLFRNRSNYVTVWFFGLIDESKPVNVVWLMLSTALGTMTAWRVLAFAHGLWRDVHELRRLEGLAEAGRKNEVRAAALDEREKQLEEQAKRAAANDGDTELRKESTA